MLIILFSILLFFNRCITQQKKEIVLKTISFCHLIQYIKIISDFPPYLQVLPIHQTAQRLIIQD